jgi:hypothetical protein
MQHLNALEGSTAVTEIDERGVVFVTGDDFRLLKSLGERVAVVWINRETTRSDDEPSFFPDRDANLHGKLIRRSCFCCFAFA